MNVRRVKFVGFVCGDINPPPFEKLVLFEAHVLFVCPGPIIVTFAFNLVQRQSLTMVRKRRTIKKRKRDIIIVGVCS